MADRHRKGYYKEWKLKYPSRAWRQGFRKRLRRQFLTVEEYIAMAVAQDWKCAICQCRLYANITCIDHSHTTQQVRGLLCKRCNAGLGCFGDNVDFMEKAITYVRERGI